MLYQKSNNRQYFYDRKHRGLADYILTNTATRQRLGEILTNIFSYSEDSYAAVLARAMKSRNPPSDTKHVWTIKGIGDVVS